MNTEHTFAFLGSSLALDFTNTVANRLDARVRRDLFGSARDVVAWAAQSPWGDQLGSQWAAGLCREQGALERIVDVREAVHDAFAAAATQRSIAAPVVNRLDAALQRCLRGRRLQGSGAGITWGWLPHARASDQMLGPIVLDAIAMLAHPPQGCVRRCDGPGCGWLFADRSPAQRRRWCSMADCGNRAKARRHYRSLVGEQDAALGTAGGAGG